MKKFEYCLEPESGYNGTFDRKEGHLVYKSGTVADLVIDTGMLNWSDYDKTIPSFVDFNDLLLKGFSPRLGEWEPFKLTNTEYIEMVEYLISLPLLKPYRKLS